jgi:hypothetical protein
VALRLEIGDDLAAGLAATAGEDDALAHCGFSCSRPAQNFVTTTGV